VADRVSRRVHSKVLMHPLLVFSIFGILGVLPDADHLYPPMARTTMLPLSILAGCFFIVALALDYRQFHKSRIGGD